MTYHNTEFPKIGETTEHAAPALRRSLSEIVAEHDEKAAAIPEAIAEFNRAVPDVAPPGRWSPRRQQSGSCCASGG